MGKVARHSNELTQLSHTIRKYNKTPILGGPGLKGVAKSWAKQNRHLSKEERYKYVDFVFLPNYGYWCMGKCPWCKDHMKGKRRRLAYKQDLRERIIWERNLWVYENCEEDDLGLSPEFYHIIYDKWSDYQDSLNPYYWDD